MASRKAGTAIADGDAELGKEFFDRARPAVDVLADAFGRDAAAEFVARRPGQRGPGFAPRKERIAIRLDPEIIAAFKASGRGWQGRINAALRTAIEEPEGGGN